MAATIRIVVKRTHRTIADLFNMRIDRLVPGAGDFPTRVFLVLRKSDEFVDTTLNERSNYTASGAGISRNPDGSPRPLRSGAARSMVVRSQQSSATECACRGSGSGMRD